MMRNKDKMCIGAKRLTNKTDRQPNKQTKKSQYNKTESGEGREGGG